jgi:cytochrome d ubiquinol oxidase subunit II
LVPYRWRRHFWRGNTGGAGSHGLFITAPVPLAVAATAFFLLRALTSKQRETQPFLLSLVLFFLCFVGLGVSIWPYVVPGQVTIWQAASPDKSLAFMLVGIAIMVPIILVYTAYAYWVFRGKVDPDAGYH